MDAGDWRSQLKADSRQTMVNMIKDTLKTHVPSSGQEGLQVLNKLSVKCEEKIYTAATSQSDYVEKIARKMLILERQSQNLLDISLPNNSGRNNNRPPDPANPSQTQQQLLSQNIQNNISATGAQTAAGLSSAQTALPPKAGLNQAPIPSMVRQSVNLQSMSGTSQNSLGNSMSQGVASNMFAISQRPIPGVQQVVSQQEQQPPQNSQQNMHRMSMQQQSNPLQQDMQRRIQAAADQVSGSMLQPPNVMELQKHLYQADRALPETSNSTAQTGHTNGADGQEEVYQKIKVMKEMYFPELREIYQKIAGKLHQHDSLPQQPKSDQIVKLKMLKTKLECLITFLQLPKSNLTPGVKERLSSYEKQIVNFISANTSRKPVPSLQPREHPPPLTSMPSQSQITQLQSHENQMNSKLQSMNLQGSVSTMQENNMTRLQQNCNSSLFRGSTSQKNMMIPLQPTSNIDAGQGTTLNSVQQVPVGSIEQTPVSASQQANMNAVSSQNVIIMLRNNINPLLSNPGILHSQHPKQQEHHLYQNQLKQQYQQRQMQQQKQEQQIIQQQQQQQVQQQAKQHLYGQLQAHQMPQRHQISDVTEVKIRPGMDVKPGNQQHMSVSQHAYPHLQSKTASPYPVASSNLLLQAQSQLSQHSSPKAGTPLHNASSSPKAGTPLRNASSPFVIPSPLTLIAPSPILGDSEKPSSLSNAGNVGHQPTIGIGAQVQSLTIGTSRISASPLLAEFIGPDDTPANSSASISVKSSVTEQPLERMIKAVKSISEKAFRASVIEIGSVVSMTDRIAGSTPGNGSRAAVGEDLVAKKCCLQARNFITHDGRINGTRKMRRYTLNVVSSGGSMNDSFKQLTGSEISDLDSTATSRIKRPRTEANLALMEEIREINRQLIETVVDISDEDVDPSAAAAERGEVIIVKCSFDAVGLSPKLKSQYSSAQLSPIQPLRLLVPTNYPNCSPILLDRPPVEASKEYGDLSVKAKSRFSMSLRSISQPMSLREIARTWDICARAVISEHAQSSGGSFSSKFGSWENCLSAA